MVGRFLPERADTAEVTTPPAATDCCRPGPDHLLAGIYRHYKGGLYQVLGLGFDANHAQRGNVVIYVPLYVRADQPGPRLAVRTARDFFAEVDPHTGLLWAEHQEFVEREGQQCACAGPVSRFTYLGATFPG